MSNLQQSDRLISTEGLSNVTINTDKGDQPITGYLQHTSFIKLFLLNLLTLNVYRFYWFYENWDAIKTSERKNILPFWRALFSFFYIYPLFKRITSDAKKEGYRLAFPYWLLATLIIITKLIILPVVLVGVLSTYSGDVDLDVNAPANELLVRILCFCLITAMYDLLFWPIQQGINFYNHKLQQKGLPTTQRLHASSIPYFDISRTRFVVLMILTLGIYRLYWEYKNWQTIKRSGERHIFPFWRAIFSIFFFHALYKRIAISAKNKGYDQPIPYLAFAAIQIAGLYSFIIFTGLFACFIPKSLFNFFSGLIILLSPIFITLWIYFPLQRAIHFYNLQTIRDYQRSTGFTRGEKILITLGLCFYLLILILLTVILNLR